MQQYGSCFRAQSHGGVFRSITSMVVAKVMDYGLSIARFCVGFVMLAGAGSSLHAPAGRLPGPGPLQGGGPAQRDRDLPRGAVRAP